MNGAAFTIDANVGQYYADFIFPYHGSFRRARPRIASSFPPRQSRLGNTGRRSVLTTTPPNNERTMTLSAIPFTSSSSTAIHTSLTASFRGRFKRSGCKAVCPHRRRRSILSSRTTRCAFVRTGGSTAAVQWPYGPGGAHFSDRCATITPTSAPFGTRRSQSSAAPRLCPLLIRAARGWQLRSLATLDHGAPLVGATATGATLKFVNRSGTVVELLRSAAAVARSLAVPGVPGWESNQHDPLISAFKARASASVSPPREALQNLANEPIF